MPFCSKCGEYEFSNGHTCLPIWYGGIPDCETKY